MSRIGVIELSEVILTALQQAVERLIAKLEQASATTQRILVKLELSKHIDLIDWMDTQALYPKFYWQSRNCREEVVALGQIKTFTDPKAAEKVISNEQRVWGGRSFDGRTERNKRCLSSFFFLPLLELSRLDNEWHIAVNVGEDRARIVTALQQLMFDTSLISGIHSKILNRSNTPDFSGWSNMLTRALDAIEHKEFEKVVLARRTTLQLDKPVSPAQLLKASCANNSNSFHFLLALDEKHGFVGSTPERLFQRHEHAIQTEALAGTIGRGKDDVEDQQLAQWLLSDNKNRYENRLVVDDIVNRLVPCSQSMNVSQTPELVQLRKVQHLKRSIDAELNSGVFSADLLDNLQPTAAIAGLPRDPALHFIAENEPFSRGWYSGAVGYISQQHSEFCVAIRSALIIEGEVHLFAGAGIVPGSVAESEWKELDRKTSTLCSLFEQETDSALAAEFEYKNASCN
ncbi:menaquinone-specific isochorismate synthase [Photobacterium angustum S14]|uniref:Isochorismate synthase MenF n=1 Tax=Photobacterium angustum (strain S14 / CCUG 15956) TaxID=314292 RepID=Q1ZRP6_PHOAS|nr:isochorismate synthase [Photobacterium angustum]EAS65281.1 menaquinone-specific isochorismate synthase [Photobacterium angustum S14]